MAELLTDDEEVLSILVPGILEDLEKDSNEQSTTQVIEIKFDNNVVRKEVIVNE